MTYLTKGSHAFYKRIQFIILSACFFACSPDHKIQPSEQLELLKWGLPEHIDTALLFSNFDTYFQNHKGLDFYMQYQVGKDSVLLKKCETINDMGEPMYPVLAKYGHKKIDPDLLANLNFLRSYLPQKPTGELILNKGEYYCDMFGLWIAIYTARNGHKKYFLFDCYGLPDSLYNLCQQINPWQPDSTIVRFEPKTTINTDSLANLAHDVLKPEFEARYAKFRTKATLKFEPPKTKVSTD
jgi:hypothetical protein